jgi:ABC-type multidrug transport system fused ATPase/permease subunit
MLEQVRLRVAEISIDIRRLSVKAFSKEDQEINQYNERIGQVLQLKYKESLAYGLFFGMTGLSGNLIVLSVFYFGGISMSEESLTIGDLSSFLLYAFWVSRTMASFPLTLHSSRCRWVCQYQVYSPFILN